MQNAWAPAKTFELSPLVVHKLCTESAFQLSNLKGVEKKGAFCSSPSWLYSKVSSTLAKLFGVKGKILGIDSKKILRPDPGLNSQYSLSYAIFCDSHSLILCKNRLKIGSLKVCVVSSKKCLHSCSFVLVLR